MPDILNLDELDARIRSVVKDLLASGVPQIKVTDPDADIVQSVLIVPGRIAVNDEFTRAVPNGLPFVQPFDGDIENVKDKLDEIIGAVNQVTGA